MIYLDSVAIVKLVHPERESDELRRWLAERVSMPRFTSVLAEIEVSRAMTRHAPSSLPNVPLVLASIARLEIAQAVRALAASYTDPRLRSLDAIHLASAQVLAAELDVRPAGFVSYDKRLLAAAAATGLNAVSPGRA